MSPNEGKIDSVQSYDSEVITAGAMQKTVKSGGKGGLSTQIQEFKDSNPQKYKELFERCGWTVDDNIIYHKYINDKTLAK